MWDLKADIIDLATGSRVPPYQHSATDEAFLVVVLFSAFVFLVALANGLLSIAWRLTKAAMR